MRLTRQIVLCVIALGVAGSMFTPLAFLKRGEYRGEVRALFNGLQLNMTRADVRRVLESGQYPHLEFRGMEESVWSASAPYEFGAGNWVLIIELKGETVSALRVRTADGVQDFHHPVEAPPDKTR